MTVGDTSPDSASSGIHVQADDTEDDEDFGDPNRSFEGLESHDEDDPDDEDEEEEEQEEGESMGSHSYDGAIDFTQYHRFDNPDKECMVILRVGNTFCVCGNPKSACKRRNHQSKQLNQSLRAPVGLYGILVRKGEPTSDGILKDFLPLEMVDSPPPKDGPGSDSEDDEDDDQDSEFEPDIEAPASPLKSPKPPKSSGRTPKINKMRLPDKEQSVTFQHQYHATRDKNATDRERTKSTPLNTRTDPSRAQAKNEKSFFCLTLMNGSRTYVDSAQDAFALQDMGARWDAMMTKEDLAQAWVAAQPKTAKRQLFVSDGSNEANHSTDHQQKNHDSDEVQVVTPHSLRKAGTTGTDGIQQLLSESSKFTREDPSTGTRRIYDFDPTDEYARDKILTPFGMDDPDSVTELYDQMMDIPTLPGAYVASDDDNAMLQLEAMATVTGGGGRRRRTTFKQWRKGTLTALTRITSKQEIIDAYTQVEKAAAKARTAQESKLRNFLYRCRYPKDYIELYVTVGPLVRLIEASLQYYLKLLGVLRSSVWEYPGVTWKGSFAQLMVEHHAKELRLLRDTSVDYPTFLMDIYVYLRNANKDSYQDNSFTRNLLYKKLNEEDSSTPTSEDADATLSKKTTSDKAPCPKCKRVGMCGGTKDTCIFGAAFSASDAQSAVKGLSISKARKVAKTLQKAQSEGKSGDIAKMIQDARSKV